MNSNRLSVYNMFVACPVCGETLEPMDFMMHVMNEHPYFFVVWASMNMPWLYTEDILSETDDIENMSYEYLLELCNMIGYHHKGVDDIDDVASKEIRDVPSLCPICLEDDIHEVRKITKCSHVFCDPCISKWLSTHTTCPVCCQDVQMRSMSTSESHASSSAGSSANTT